MNTTKNIYRLLRACMITTKNIWFAPCLYGNDKNKKLETKCVESGI